MLPGFISDLGIFVNNQPPYGDISFISTGTYIFTVPDNVNSISVVLVGGGGAGGQSNGGGGGALTYKNNIKVRAGSTCTVTVGKGGIWNQIVGGSDSAGGDSTFGGVGITTVTAKGGAAGSNGGSGGAASASVTNGGSNKGGSGGGYGGEGGGGGGAGGYTASGGNGVTGSGASGAGGDSGNAGDSGGYGGTGSFPDGGGGGGQGLYGLGNSAYYTSVPFSGCLVFNGSQGVQLPTTTALQFGSGDFTIEFWINGGSNQTTYCCITDASTNNTATEVGIGINNGGTPGKISFQADGSGQGTLVGSTTITDSKWHHVACVKSGSNGYIFIDGKLDASTTSWGAVSNAYLSGGAFGRSYYANGGNTDNTFNGSLTNFRVSNVAKYPSAFTVPTAPLTSDTSTAILILANNTVPPYIDSSNHAFTLNSLNGAPVYNSNTPFNSQGMRGGVDGDSLLVPYNCGGAYGGGGSCTGNGETNPLNSQGGSGAVRIVWPGDVRQFPYTNEVGATLPTLPSSGTPYFTFTNAGITGPTGPALSDCLANYDTVTYSWLNDTNRFNVLTQGIQLWTVPATGNYRIKVAGAHGGNNTYGVASTPTGGKGAVVSGDMTLTSGTVLAIVVGQPGVTNTSGQGSSGGGGGSFVYLTATNTLLFAAGGGGGVCGYSGANITPPIDGQTTSGTNGGNGGSSVDGGGGEGWNSPGASGQGAGGGQQGQFYGGTGAGNYGATAGGWGGGGGGGDAYGGGGGGGGYQGGNGGGDPSSGTGGYSYITTLANPSATYHGNTGTGYVEILTL